MTMRVAFRRSRLRLTISWVRLSSALVASSKRMIRGRWTIARAIRMRCFWPPEKVSAPSLITVCMPIGMALMSSSRPGHPRRLPGVVDPQVRAADDVREDAPRHRPAGLQDDADLAADGLHGERRRGPGRRSRWSRRSGFSKPRIRRRQVDLPAPEGPTRAMNSPGPARKETSSRISGPSPW